MSEPEQAPESPRDAERMKFFTDAVVAIAMTLLILPLLESVADSRDLTTAQYLHEHRSQLISFVISFVVIASFWVSHERLFDWVGSWTGRLMVLNIAWMLSIVFLPVTTAMTGSMETDRAQIAIYIGTMLVSSVLMLGMNLVVRRTPAVWAEGRVPGLGGVTASISLVLLFVVSLALAMVFPGGSYLWLFVLFGSGPLQAVLERRLGPRSDGLTPRTR